MFLPKQCHKKKLAIWLSIAKRGLCFLNKLLFDFKKLKSRVIEDTFAKVFI